MKKLTLALTMLLTLCAVLTGCHRIDSDSDSDYPEFYNTISNVMPTAYSLLPDPEAIESIDDIYLYYSDYDLIDSYYTIYLECSFTADSYESEKQRALDCGGQYDFALYDSDSFSYDSVYINQCIEQGSGGFIAIQISYALFDEENNRIIYVDTFEEGTKSEWRTSHIPEKYLPVDLIDLIE